MQPIFQQLARRGPLPAKTSCVCVLAAACTSRQRSSSSCPSGGITTAGPISVGSTRDRTAFRIGSVRPLLSAQPAEPGSLTGSSRFTIANRPYWRTALSSRRSIAMATSASAGEKGATAATGSQLTFEVVEIENPRGLNFILGHGG